MSDTINAVQFTRAGNFSECEDFVGGDAEFRNGRMVIATLQGALWVEPGQWIVRDEHGVFHAENSPPTTSEPPKQ